jgi:hypothetical protein
MPSNRARRGVIRSAKDRKTQLATGAVTVVGAAAVAGTVASEHLERAQSIPAAPSRPFCLKRVGRLEKGAPSHRLGRIDNAEEDLVSAECGDQALSIHAARKELKKLGARLRPIREESGRSEKGHRS